MEANQTEARTHAGSSGSIFSFLPAHGDSRAGAVAEFVSRTLTEGFGLVVLLADFEGDRYSPWRLDGHVGNLLNYAREKYSIICIDLTGAKEAEALEALRASDAIFLVSGSDAASIHSVQEKAAWLQSTELSDQCGLLLWRAPNSVDPTEVEDLTGLPVCSLVDNDEQVRQLASWLASQTTSEVPSQESKYAMAG